MASEKKIKFCLSAYCTVNYEIITAKLLSHLAVVVVNFFSSSAIGAVRVNRVQLHLGLVDGSDDFPIVFKLKKVD